MNIAGVNAPGIWKIGIHNDDNGHFVVSALYCPNQSGEAEIKTIAPLIFKGTAEDSALKSRIILFEQMNSYKITDLDGKEIVITDLPLAILQADDYRHYRVAEQSECHLHIYDYWEDVYQKLLLLDKHTNSNL